MQRRFYPDANVVHLVQATWGTTGFEERARSADCHLALGLHIIYELARGFIFPRHIETAKGVFKFLSELDRLELLPPLDAVVRAEFHLAATGVPIITVLEPHNQLLARQEILKLASGYADDARQFISARESDISLRHPEIARSNMMLARDFLSRNPDRRPQMRTFAGFREQVLPTGRQTLRNLATRHGITVHDSRLDAILNDPGLFPVLNTWLNAQWYLVYVSAMHQAVPSPDKLDDFRHLIESANCDVFVTNDTELVHRSQTIQPFRATSSWNNFEDWFSAGQWEVPTI